MKTQRKVIILYVILGVLLLFIWGNSMLPVAQSAAESRTIGKIITPFLELFVGQGNVTDHLVRKLAHFCEFGALGLTLGLILLTKRQRNSFHISYMIFCGLAVAVADESIQLISAGRGAQIQDVLLDTAGVFFGLFVVVVLFYLIRKDDKSKKNK